MKKIAIVFLGCALICGCSKVSRLDQLLTLKGLAEEQESVNQQVEVQNKYFDLMLKEMEDGTLDEYSNKEEILSFFSDPVFARFVSEGEEELEVWLYRYATQYFGVEKVYLYFDAEGDLVRLEYVEGKNGKSRQETSPEDGLEEI